MSGRFPWRKAWQPTPVFLPGESHGQRSLEGYSPWGREESDTTEAAEHAHTGRIGRSFFLNFELSSSGIVSPHCHHLLPSRIQF